MAPKDKAEVLSSVPKCKAVRDLTEETCALNKLPSDINIKQGVIKHKHTSNKNMYWSVNENFVTSQEPNLLFP